jgi:hypothetical protein
MLAAVFLCLIPLQEFNQPERRVEPTPPTQTIPSFVLKRLEAPRTFPRAVRERDYHCHGRCWDAVELDWLARHQQADGSWDASPRNCTCPRSEPSKRSVKEAVQDLSSSDIDRRDAAVSDLVRVGRDARDARDAIRKEMEGADDEMRGRCSKILAEIDRLDSARHATTLELTALALAAFLWRGFTQDSLNYGPVVRKGLDGLEGARTRCRMLESLSASRSRETRGDLRAVPGSNGRPFSRRGTLLQPL